VKLIDVSHITDQEREIAQIIRDHPALWHHITLLLNGYRGLVQVSIAGADPSDVQRDLLKKEASMQRIGIPLLETPQDWERERMRKGE